MQRVRPADTAPERAVRSILTALGYRYRLHRSDLPGKPDIVFPSRRKVIFVHGCFWHRHARCNRATMPRRNVSLWVAKFERTVARDRRNVAMLRRSGWKVLVVWECDTRDQEQLKQKLGTFLQ
ncbi:MAG: DNA mismatch endonuclease Vsr [Phycisphaerae bacterium]|nr:DNA mismatch endonuclease Vsr [Phycisphaerae bacterium]